MDARLVEILKHNPFREEVVEKWVNSISERSLNPFDGRYENSTACVLGSDVKIVEEENVLHPCYEAPFHIHGEFLPHPFLGHPSAPIWVLLVNPSWCHVDVFDMLNVSQEAVVYSESPLCDDPKQRQATVDISKTTQFEHRMELQRRQLLLEKDCGFFSLDNSFETCTVEGNVSYGANGWWKKCLFGAGVRNNNFPFSSLKDSNGRINSELVGRKLFVLEFSPYRSRHFSQQSLTDINNGRSEYGKFWNELVQYAFAKEKIVIIRALKTTKNSLIKRRLADLGLDCAAPNVTFLRNCQNVRLSKRNFENERVYGKMIEAMKA